MTWHLWLFAAAMGTLIGGAVGLAVYVALLDAWEGEDGA